MSEWWLIGLLSLIVVLVSGLLVYPLKYYRKLSVVLFSLIIFVSVSSYYYWGSYFPWSEFVKHERKEKLAKAMLKEFKNPQDIIAMLKTKLDDTPKSAKGWYLLGKLYLNQQDTMNATKALAKAHELQPDNEQFAVHYGHSLWENNQQVFNQESREIFLRVLKHNPKQPDALAMLAMDAYASKRYPEAIAYWQDLLKLAPKHSEEARAIQQAIVKAQEHIA